MISAKLFQDLEKALLDWQESGKAIDSCYPHLTAIFIQLINVPLDFERNCATLVTILNKIKVTYSVNLLVNYTLKHTKVKIMLTPFQNILETEKADHVFEDRFVPELTSAFQRSDRNRPWLEGGIIIPQINDGEHRLALALLEYLIDDGFAKQKWDNEDVEFYSYLLELYYHIAKKTDDLDSFYLTSALVFERLRTSIQYSIAENYIGKLIAVSRRDNRLEFGLYVMGKWWRSNSNLLQASTVHTLAMLSAISKGFVNATFYRLLVEEWMELVGQAGYLNVVNILYDKLNREVPLTEYNRASLDIKYYVFLLTRGQLTDDGITQLHERITRHPVIFQSGSNLGLGYLNLILAISRGYPNSDSAKKLQEFVPPLRKQVGEQESDYLTRIYDKSQATPLLSTLAQLDSVLMTESSDNAIASILRSRLGEISSLHESAIARNSIPEYLYSMKFKTDFALAVLSRKTNPNQSLASTNKSPLDYQSVQQLRFAEEEGIVTYLSTDHDQIFSLSFSEGGFGGIKSVQNWTITDHEKFCKLIRDYIGGKVKAQFRKVAEDILSGPRLAIDDSKRQLLLVKDLWISDLPHNLIRNDHGDFIILQRPMTDILSFDWFSGTVKQTITPPSVQCYIPTETSDSAIMEVYGDRAFRELLPKHNIELITETIPPTPCNSNINIIVSHGRDDIGEFYALFDGETYVLNVDEVVGRGKVAILFVCNSGAMRMADYSQKASSLIRDFFLKGYEAVIAPAWNLSTAVPSLWLEEFLDRLKQGDTISEAHQRAILRLYRTRMFIEDWACLHLYGNPNLRFA